MPRHPQTPSLLRQLNSDWFYLSGTGLPRLYWSFQKWSWVSWLSFSFFFYLSWNRIFRGEWYGFVCGCLFCPNWVTEHWRKQKTLVPEPVVWTHTMFFHHQTPVEWGSPVPVPLEYLCSLDIRLLCCVCSKLLEHGAWLGWIDCCASWSSKSCRTSRGFLIIACSRIRCGWTGWTNCQLNCSLSPASSVSVMRLHEISCNVYFI